MLEILYKAIWAVMYLGIAAGSAALAWVTIRFNLKRREVRDYLSPATSEQIGRVVDLVESIGTEPPIGGILIPTNDEADLDAVINIPEGISEFPWSGKSASMKFDPDLSFDITDREADESRLRGQRYKFMPIPRIRTKSGKARNIFDPARYMKLQPKLEDALSEICPDHPAKTTAKGATLLLGLDRGRGGSTNAEVRGGGNRCHPFVGLARDWSSQPASPGKKVPPFCKVRPVA